MGKEGIILKRWLSFFAAVSMVVVLFAQVTPVLADADEKGISWMCVGDSITYGNGVPGGYRAPLYNLYKEQGINLRMVGPNNANNGDGLLPEGSGHAGYGGNYIREISNKIIPWLESYQPQVVSLQIGTNDILQNKTSKFPDDTRDTAPDRLSELIDKIIATLPEAEVFVAKIPPLDSAYNKFIIAYNDSVESVVTGKGSKVHLVDNYTALNDALKDNLQSDGIHPTLTGYQKMSRSWFNASQSVVSQLTPKEPLRLMSTAKTGKYLLHLTSPANASFKSVATGEMTVETETDYEISFYTKGVTGVTILAKAITSEWKDIKAVTFENGPAWSKCTFQFNSGTNKKIRFAIFDNSAAAGDVYIDDCSLVKLEDETKTNLIKNPGFENGNASWDVKAPFEIIQSLDVLNPPAVIEAEEKKIAKTLNITMDTFTDKDLPTDISAVSYNNNGFYTVPDQQTETFVAAKKGMFYKDSAGKGYMMLNPINSYQTAKFWMDKGGYKDISGFDEVRFKFKAMKQTNRDQSVYEGKTPANYRIKVGLGDATMGSNTVVSAKEIYLQPTKFSLLADECEEMVFQRSDFAGNALDMEGNLKAYTDENNQNHVLQLTFVANGGVGWLIDEIEFIWYDNEPTASITELGFTNNGENINAYGLRNGENILNATLYNPTTANLENAQLILTLVNKTTGRMEEIKTQPVSLAGKETKSDFSLSVTVPYNVNPKDYETRVMIFRGFDSLSPILVHAYRFDGNGEVKN